MTVMIEIETQDRSNAMIDFVGGQGMEEMGVNLRDMIGNLFPNKTVRRKIKIAEAKTICCVTNRKIWLIWNKSPGRRSIRLENSGIIFLDEMDKIAGRESGSRQPRRIPRRGAARSFADRGGNDR